MIQAFFSALSFYTRLPVPKSIHLDEQSLNKATVFLPLIGLIVGGVCAGCYFAASLVFPKAVAAVISLIAGVLFTGAFHEDGFSDTCDGLGGGFTIEDKLNIMKDSRVGAYGLVGTLLLILLKFALLTETPSNIIIPAIMVIHVISRLTPVYLIFFLDYVRLDQKSKAKPVSRGISLGGLIIASSMAMVFSALLNPYFLLFFTAFPLLVLFFVLFYKKQAGGYTGDLLGASEQISEALLLGGVYIQWTFIV
ncbi:MAG: adenosylcobinamide-GDP ribazoletransferase [Spirochaetales bacterium]|nr:adenosylcobinamide-GDP ribazoletransferase [Spirochaetales bacterium]